MADLHPHALTVPQAAEHLSAHFGVEVPVWKVRRVADQLDADIPRAGNYRLIPRSLLDRIAEGCREWVAKHRGSDS